MNPILDKAFEYLGVAEVGGSDSHPIILKWIQQYFSDADDDSRVAWCSIFMLSIFKMLKLPCEGATPLARSWLKVGKEVDTPEAGDVVVFWRGSKSSWMGHVGIVVSTNVDGKLIVISGNDEDKVRCRAYSKSRVLGYRRMNYVL